jgi:6-phosphofructokinase 1
MRAGPRNTQFFDPKKVRADIVCLGKLCPGINTIIRELVFMLKNVYKVDKVFGVKSSFDGYYINNSDPSSKTII